ncbi:MAG: hypothetical protein P8Y66_08025 [Nitrospirota bacterium]
MKSRQFEQDLVALYENVWVKCGYREPRLLSMVEEWGGVEAAKRILSSGRFLFGTAELGRCNCMGATLEALVLDPRYADLFTAEERITASSRLKSWVCAA